MVTMTADPSAHLMFNARRSSFDINNPDTWAPYCIDEVSIHFLIDQIKEMLSIRAQPFFQVLSVIRLLTRYCHSKISSSSSSSRIWRCSIIAGYDLHGQDLIQLLRKIKISPTAFPHTSYTAMHKWNPTHTMPPLRPPVMNLSAKQGRSRQRIRTWLFPWRGSINISTWFK